jgi:hypothetical protein
MSFYQLYDHRYKEFLAASTVLASTVHPSLREEVLEIEDLWEAIDDKGFKVVTGKVWFDKLDATRSKILDGSVQSFSHIC